MGIEHAIRQALLRDMKLYAGAPITADELIRISQEPAIRRHEASRVMEEFVELQALGYIEAIPGYRGKYCQITARGRQQLIDDFPQDPFVWGPGAI